MYGGSHCGLNLHFPNGQLNISCAFLPSVYPLDAAAAAAKSLQLCPTLVTLWTIAHHSPLSMAFSRQEYWSGLPFTAPGDPPDPGIKLRSPALQTDSLPSEPLEKRYSKVVFTQNFLTLLHYVHFSYLITEPVLVFLFFSH